MIFLKILKNIQNDLMLASENDSIFEIMPHEVNFHFRKLKQCKASGPDHLSCKVLKLCSRELSSIFC